MVAAILTNNVNSDTSIYKCRCGSGTGPRVPRARRRLPASRRVRRAVSRGPPRGAPGRPPRRGDLRHVGWEAHTGAAPGIALGGVKPQHLPFQGDPNTIRLSAYLCMHCFDTPVDFHTSR